MSYITSSGGGSGSGSVTTLTGNTGGPISPVAGNINVVGAGSIAVSGSGNTLTITNTSTTFMWSVVTGATMTLVANNGYFANSGGTILFTLPSSGSIGDTITIVNINTALGWAIVQGVSQYIRLGDVTTTPGPGGGLFSSEVGDSITFVCGVAGGATGWFVTSSIGNITIV